MMGLRDRQSDSAVSSAGRLILDFARPAYLSSLSLSESAEGGRMYLFTASGALLSARDIPVLSAGKCELVWLGEGGVGRLELMFFGRGAIGELSYELSKKAVTRRSGAAPASKAEVVDLNAYGNRSSVASMSVARKGFVGADEAVSRSGGNSPRATSDRGTVISQGDGVSVSRLGEVRRLRSSPGLDRYPSSWTSASAQMRPAAIETSPLTETAKKSEKRTVPCFTPGTSIATPKGEYLVEDLQVGDKVITRDNGTQEIRWIGMRRLDGRELQANQHLRPILFQQGSLGHGLPERDMLVSPNHRMLVANDKVSLFFKESEVLVAAKHLLSTKAGIQNIASMGTTYIHFMFDRHEVILANGAWSESFQPADKTLKGLGNAQRNELYELFPELKEEKGAEAYASARRTLKKHQVKMLFR